MSDYVCIFGMGVLAILSGLCMVCDRNAQHLRNGRLTIALGCAIVFGLVWAGG